MFLFGKIPDQVAALLIVLSQHVKQERLHVIVQSLMVQKQLRQQTQVLTVNLIHITIHLEHGYLTATVNLRGGRMLPRALILVPLQHRLALRVLQTELAEEQLRQTCVLLGKWARVPRLNFVLAKLDGGRIARLRAHLLRWR